MIGSCEKFPPPQKNNFKIKIIYIRKIFSVQKFFSWSSHGVLLVFLPMWFCLSQSPMVSSFFSARYKHFYFSGIRPNDSLIHAFSLDIAHLPHVASPPRPILLFFSLA